MGLHPYISTGLRWLLWTVLALAAFVLCCRVVNAYGQVWGAVISAAGAGAAWMPTDQCRRIIGLFANAVRRHMSEKAAAITMGMSKSQYSEGINCVKQISMSRAADVDEEVWLAFAVDLLQQSGRYVVLEKSEVSDLVFEVSALRDTLREQAAEAEARTAPVRMERMAS